MTTVLFLNEWMAFISYLADVVFMKLNGNLCSLKGKTGVVIKKIFLCVLFFLWGVYFLLPLSILKFVNVVFNPVHCKSTAQSQKYSELTVISTSTMEFVPWQLTDEEAIIMPDVSGEASVTHITLGLLWEIKSDIFSYSVSPDKQLFAVEFSLRWTVCLTL